MKKNLEIRGYDNEKSQMKKCKFEVSKLDGKYYIHVISHHILGFNSENIVRRIDSQNNIELKLCDEQLWAEVAVGDYILTVDTRISEKIADNLEPVYETLRINERYVECYKVLNIRKNFASTIQVRIDMAYSEDSELKISIFE